MIIDEQSLLLFVVKAAYTLAALVVIGLGLHTVLGVLPPKRGAVEFKLYAAAAGVTLLLMLARLVLLNSQLGGDLSAGFDASFFAWTWAALGSATLAAMLGCAMAGAAAAIGNRWLAGASAIPLAASFALTGHTADADPAGFASAAAAIHVLIAGFWIGAPISLYPRSALDSAELHRRLQQFSRCATFLVPIMFALGLWLAWTLAGGLQPLFGTLYGGLLLAKLLAAALALGLGAVNQGFVTGLIVPDPARGRKWLTFTLFVDAGLFVVAILAISAATTLTGPPTRAPMTATMAPMIAKLPPTR